MDKMDGCTVICVFFLNAVALFGVHFAHDLPSPLQGIFQASPYCTNPSVNNFANETCITGLGFTPFEYNQLYAIYSIGEATAAVFAGYLIDRLGRTVNLISSGLLILIGAVTFALGPSCDSAEVTLALMLIGRLFMAISNAFLFVLQGVITAIWFEDRVSSAFGAISSANAAGEVLNFLATKHLSNALGLQWTLWIGAIVVIVGSSIPIFMLGYLESKRTSEHSLISLPTIERRMRLLDLLDFPVQYWLLMMSRIFFNSMIWALFGDISKFITDKYDYSESSAVPSYFAGIFFGLSTAGCFFAGKLMDYIGYRLVITSISSLGTMATLSLLAFTFFPPHVCAVFISIFYVFQAVSAISCILLTVPEAAAGTAVGLTLALEMVLTAASNIIIGLILGNKHITSDAVVLRRWKWVIIYTIGLTGISFIFSLMANLRDFQTEGDLNKKQSEIVDGRQTKNGFQRLTQSDGEN